MYAAGRRETAIRIVLIDLILMVSMINHSVAQEKEPAHLFRIYEDNDGISLIGSLTDNAYTNGTSFEYFYSKLKSSRFFVGRWMPKAGKNAINVFNWKLTQLMVTPDNTDTTTFQPNDYPYAGALFATHGLVSYNVSKKYSFSTEIIFGIRGPASLAEQTQKLIHRILDNPEPRGWKNQLKTSPLININFGVEKQLVAAGQYFELISGAKLYAGSFKDVFSIYPLVRIGKMSPYFDGLLKQFGSYGKNNRKVATQFYLIVSPAMNWTLHDALLYGETANSSRGQSDQVETRGRKIRNLVMELQYGAVFAYGRFSISFLQTHSTEYNTGLYRHSYANISATIRW